MQPSADEVVAVVAALAALRPAQGSTESKQSPWKMAARNPELTLEDLRAKAR
jgi:hypothetical protein